MKLTECFSGTVADLHSHGRRQALSLEDLCLDNTSIKKMERTGVRSGGGQNWKAVIRILEDNLMKQLQINLWNGIGQAQVGEG